ncbi:MAG: hypothetical protein WC055_00995 [Melioribacteraceae bacterium]
MIPIETNQYIKKIGEANKLRCKDPTSGYNSEEGKKRRKDRLKGSGNPRYGDHRKFDELHGQEKSKRLKEICRNNTQGFKNPNAKEWVFVSPSGDIIKVKGEVKRFCKENGLSYTSLKRYVNKVFDPKIIHERYKNKTLNTKGWCLYEADYYYRKK